MKILLFIGTYPKMFKKFYNGYIIRYSKFIKIMILPTPIFF